MHSEGYGSRSVNFAKSMAFEIEKSGGRGS